MKPTFGEPIQIGLDGVPALNSVMPVKVPLPASAPFVEFPLLSTEPLPARVALLIPQEQSRWYSRQTRCPRPDFREDEAGQLRRRTVPEKFGKVVVLAGLRFHCVASATSPGDK